MTRSCPSGVQTGVIKMNEADDAKKMSAMLRIALGADPAEGAAALDGLRRFCTSKGINFNNLHLFDRTTNWQGGLLEQIDSLQRKVEKLRGDKIKLLDGRRSASSHRSRRPRFIKVDPGHLERVLSEIEPQSNKRVTAAAQLLKIKPAAMRDRVRNARIRRSELKVLEEEASRSVTNRVPPAAPAAGPTPEASP